MARVLYRDSQGRDGEVVLQPNQPCYVGRALDCAVRTDDAMVSRKHSMIRMENGRFYVEDLGSSNGTLVNDVQVSKHFLSHNDVVRCGSLWLRYIEDPGAAQAAQPAGQAAPPKKNKTMRIDANDGGGGGQPQAAQPQPQPAQPQPAQPQPAWQPGATAAPQGPAPMQGAPAGGPQAYGNPPSMPQQAPYGGPPAMPQGGVVGGDVQAPTPSQQREEKEDSVVVDMDSEEVAKLKADLERIRSEFEELQTGYDREVADSKRLRAESATLKERIEELRRAVRDRDEAVEAHAKVAEELREELKQTKDELASARGEIGELGETVGARDRQLARAQDDIGKLKEEIEEQSRQIAELGRTKDEGWKKLNEQLGEIEHLREVINQQERMLEERRVGLVSQEQALVELRESKERFLQEKAQLQAERDELRADAGRLEARIAAIDEENRRLSQLCAELQGDSGAAGGSGAPDLAGELKELRIQLKTLESDRDQLQEGKGRAEKQVEELRERVAALEVELRDKEEAREKALGAKQVAEEALAKAEVARHKAAEEALESNKARDSAVTSTDELRRELERAQKRVAELEQRDAAEAPADQTAELEEEKGRLEKKLEEAQARIGELQRTLETRDAELEAARIDVKAAQKAGEATLDEDAVEATDVVDMSPQALKSRALEVHDSINDLLSELRQNAMIVQGELEEMAGREDAGEVVRMMLETVEALVGGAEEAKGAIRSLRELVELGE